MDMGFFVFPDGKHKRQLQQLADQLLKSEESAVVMETDHCDVRVLRLMACLRHPHKLF